jgi:hypothetical protein
MTRQAVTKHLNLLERANLIAVRLARTRKAPLPQSRAHPRNLRALDQQVSERDHLQALAEFEAATSKRPQTLNPMQPPKFVYVTLISTTPEKLWAALTDPRFTVQYWGGTSIESDWQAGSPVVFRWHEKIVHNDTVLEMRAAAAALLHVPSAAHRRVARRATFARDL